ncbi:hypothetical protein MUK42_04195 [Musa troglodytarum]|uniref:Uncharacterized protein n=1 Tax=Musa troglodytarum TaxID=320322 RepID=A0A9E7GBS2_9LILI|nr:hypothetical protein MUK42_04195 [Musa troglodytarum]
METMQQHSADRRSTYLAALTLEIERKLQKALISPRQRPELLQQLFADVALEVEDRARDMIFKKDEDKITSADDGIENNLCFYDVLADYFVGEPENGKHILDLIVQLWSQSFVSHIFVLIFHNYLKSLLKILKHCYVMDLPLFKVLPMFSGLTSKQIGRDFFPCSVIYLRRLHLYPIAATRSLCRPVEISVFFSPDDLLEKFLGQFPGFPNAFLVGGPADIFVIELADQLQKLKVEPVLLHYLSRMSALKGLELRMTTSTRLKACLYSFTSPGGPMYPTRVVRHAAWDTLDLLFPVGQYPRHIISLFFRLLYPWYWPSSCWNFIVTCARTVVFYVLRIVGSSWENMRKSKDS